jgi:glutamate synthase (NADPH/NADH) small chain
MEFLPWANRVQQGDLDEPEITATGKHVVIIGGGDTGADCLGTSHRQGAASVTQLEIMPTPPEHRTEGMPWPTYPMVYRVSSAHEEGGERLFSVNTTEFVDDGTGKVKALRLVEVKRGDRGFEAIEGTEKEIPADLVLLAMGFVGPEKGSLLDELGVELDERGNVSRDDSFMSSVDGVFVAGDAGRGQSLIVWAISEGRSAAAGVDKFLTGREVLPRPIDPTDRQIA